MRHLKHTLQRTFTHRLAIAATLVAVGSTAFAQAKPEGYLCCNMRSDGKWISDSNYAESGKFVVPAGTPIKVLDYARYRVLVDLQGSQQALGNDYSRDLPMEAFARRYVVTQDPQAKLASWPRDVQDAVTSARVMRGMTREQVLMALGYPISSETPHLDSRVWRYWLWTFSPFEVHFSRDGLVTDVQTDRETRERVVKE